MLTRTFLKLVGPKDGEEVRFRSPTENWHPFFLKYGGQDRAGYHYFLSGIDTVMRFSASGVFVQEIPCPEKFYVHDLIVTPEGKIYMYNQSLRRSRFAAQPLAFSLPAVGS